jgi:hypothetical protein
MGKCPENPAKPPNAPQKKRSKKVKNNLTGDTVFAIVVPHTVTTKHE